MITRAKFNCTSVERYAGGETVKLSAVSGDENKPWSQYTPNGQISISITNPALAGKFDPGRAYFIDISSLDRDVDE